MTVLLAVTLYQAPGVRKRSGGILGPGAPPGLYDSGKEAYRYRSATISVFSA